jgi:hypothetical protein
MPGTSFFSANLRRARPLGESSTLDFEAIQRHREDRALDLQEREGGESNTQTKSKPRELQKIKAWAFVIMKAVLCQGGARGFGQTVL